MIGGSDGVAKQLIETAIANRKPCRHRQQGAAGPTTARRWRWPAEAAGVTLAYEAAVAGGIPIIKALREGLAGQSGRAHLRHPQRHLQITS